jgi:hypothetical protein
MRTSEMEPKDEGKLRVEHTSLDLDQALLVHGPGTAQTNPHHNRDAIALALMEVLGIRPGRSSPWRPTTSPAPPPTPRHLWRSTAKAAPGARPDPTMAGSPNCRLPDPAGR